MKIEIKHLLAQPEGTTETHPIEQANLELSDDTTANISGTTILTALDDFILANIAGQADITLPCHRCLTPTQLTISLDFSNQFYPRTTPPNLPLVRGGAEGLDEEDIYPIEDGHIDLTLPITTEIIASLPVKVLCNDNCLGLCPICGNNLNDNPCKCDKVEFEVLNKIRFKDGSTTETEAK